MLLSDYVTRQAVKLLCSDYINDCIIFEEQEDKRGSDSQFLKQGSFALNSCMKSRKVQLVNLFPSLHLNIITRSHWRFFWLVTKLLKPEKELRVGKEKNRPP